MKCVTFDGLGEFLFYDVRKDDDGNDKDHPLNEPKFAEASILISNANFGCTKNTINQFVTFRNIYI